MHGFASWHDFRQSRDFAVVRINIQFAKFGKSAGGCVSMRIMPQPAINVVVHGIQQLVVQQNVLPGGAKARPSRWDKHPRTPTGVGHNGSARDVPWT